jgi:hypothetical protein
VRSGNAINCDVNWESSFSPPAGPPDAVIDYTGGHLHPLPNGADPNRAIWILCSDIDPGPGACQGADLRGRVPTKFRGMSKNDFWFARKTAPEVSGEINGSAIVTFFPPLDVRGNVRLDVRRLSQKRFVVCDIRH